MKLKAGQFYGKTSQTLAADGLRFTEKSYSLSAKLPSHAHELAHFCFVLSGSYSEQIGLREFERKPSALVYYPPEVSHAERHLTGGRHFLVEIDFKGLNKVREYGASLNEPVFLQNRCALVLASRMYEEFSRNDAFSPLALESITTELLISASRENLHSADRTPPRWIEKVKEILHENYSDSLHLNDLAAAAGVHPTHLARVFRRFQHCTVGDYIRRLRIEQARQKIIFSDESLVAIALDTGFADQTHFSRTFKDLTGMTPTEFRRIFRSR